MSEEPVEKVTGLRGLARLDSGTIHELERAIAAGESIEELSGLFGIDRRTLRRYVARREEAEAEQDPIENEIAKEVTMQSAITMKNANETVVVDDPEVAAVLASWPPISRCTISDLFRGAWGGRWADDHQRIADLDFVSRLGPALRDVGREAVVADIPAAVVLQAAQHTRRRFGRWWQLAGSDDMPPAERIDEHWHEPRLAAAREVVAEERERQRLAGIR